MAMLRLLVLVLLAVSLYAQSAADLAFLASKAEKKKEYSKAYLLYSQAAALDPKNRDYWVHGQLLRTKAILEQKSAPVSEAQRSTFVEQEEEKILQSISAEDLAEARRPLPPKELKASPESRSFDLKGTARELFEKVAKAYGLDVVFDGDYAPAGQPLSFHLENADYRLAIRALEACTGSFTFPLGDRLFMAAKDTPQKRTEIEPTATVTIPIPDPFSVQEVQELARSVQQAMEIPRLTVDSTRRLVLIRDRVSKVYAAQALFQQLVAVKSQVAMEIEFIEVNENSTLDFGLRLPTQFPVVHFGRLPWKTAASIPSGFLKFLTFGGGATLFGIGLTDAELFASMTQSQSKTLMRAELRSVDGMPAQLHVGDRYPIVTNQYMGGSAVSPGGQSYAPPPSFNFEDLGIVLKITPRVHSREDMTLAIEAEFKVLTGEALNGIPIIANRKFASTMRLRTGQWGILAGLLGSSDARSITGIYGVATLPGIGPLLSQNSRQKTKGQIVIVVRPRIVSQTPEDQVNTRTFWLGSEARPLSPL